jgi:hypothetical protein
VGVRVRINVDEVIKYQTVIEAEMPEGMSDEDFEEILGRAEAKGRFEPASDLVYTLERIGIQAEVVEDNYPDNPYSSEIEITYVEDIAD